MSGRPFELEGWARREHFEFFRPYEHPFFDICAEVEVGPTQAYIKAHGLPFSLSLWFACQRALNAVESLRLRLRPDGQIWIHDRIYVATTAAQPDGTFAFVHLPADDTFSVFVREAKQALEGVDPDRSIDDRPDQDGLVHGSILPWLRFTSVSHARRDDPLDSVPKIVFGKATQTPDGVRLPVSVSAHHALVDGRHVAEFFAHFEAALACPERTFGE